MNQKMHYMQMNMMNNMMNFENNFNPDLNPLLNNQGINHLSQKVINVVFEYNNKFINIIAQEYLPINEVINRFLAKIGKPELINKYKNKMLFLFDGSELDHSKKVNEISNHEQHFQIIVIDRNLNSTF